MLHDLTPVFQNFPGRTLNHGVLIANKCMQYSVIYRIVLVLVCLTFPMQTTWILIFFHFNYTYVAHICRREIFLLCNVHPLHLSLMSLLSERKEQQDPIMTSIWGGQLCFMQWSSWLNTVTTIFWLFCRIMKDLTILKVLSDEDKAPATQNADSYIAHLVSTFVPMPTRSWIEKQTIRCSVQQPSCAPPVVLWPSAGRTQSMSLTLRDTSPAPFLLCFLLVVVTLLLLKHE